MNITGGTVMFLLLMCIGWKETSCQASNSTTEQLKCQQRMHLISLCGDLNYSTALPNLIGQSNPTDIENEFLRFSFLFNCSNALLLFLCSVYAPLCDEGSGNETVIYLPCRNLCEHVYMDCITVFHEFQYPWPTHLRCSAFPEYHSEEKNCFGPSDPTTIPYPNLPFVQPPMRQPDTEYNDTRVAEYPSYYRTVNSSHSTVIAITSGVSVLLLLPITVLLVTAYIVGIRRVKEIKINNSNDDDDNNNNNEGESETVAQVASLHTFVSAGDMVNKHFERKLAPCMINCEDLQILELIGEGAFSVVYKGIYTRNGITIVVAVKTIKTGSVLKSEEFVTECSTTKRFDHPNVLSIIGVASPPEETIPMMVLPFMLHGDVKSFLKSKRGERIKVDEYPMNLSHEVLVKICLDIAKGMDYLSSMRFVHRDLAARNCMMDEDMTTKVGDFGLSRDIYISDYYKLNHNAPLPVKWLAPEALFDKTFSTKSDVWSFGVTYWEVFTLGLQPYATVDAFDMGTYLMKGNVLDKPSLSSDEMYDIMSSCWKFTPEDRPSFNTLSEAISQQLKDVMLSCWKFTTEDRPNICTLSEDFSQQLQLQMQCPI
ncbi:tyrosine-protein kinase Mer-like isoform X2 [Dysidea avara]|uniref:tyrosine-protein kinase Mer-like isoform X2 n=1 Tax=Dysidea avara TaxID=196820 RepID=UPI00332A85C8